MSSFHRHGRRRRPRRFLRWVILLLLLAAAVWLAAGWRAGSLVRRAQDALLAGEPERTARLLDRAAFYRAGAGKVLEARGLAALLAGRDEEAGRLLAEARTAGVRRSGLDLPRAAASLADGAQYEALAGLAAHRQEAGGADIPPLFAAEAELALDRLDAAAALLARAAAGERRDRLQEILSRRKRDGRAISLVDRTGRPVYGRQLGSGEAVVEVPELGAALDGPEGLLARLERRDRTGVVTLTLDLTYQRAAHAALGRFAGAFVALDPASGEILALVNHPGAGDGGVPAYRRQFEPGSILKMITLAATLDGGVDPGSLFPLSCSGNMTLDGRLFYDWTRHGTVADADAATAVSCNLAFAAMGLELGQARLDDALRAFGFGQGPPAGDLLMEFGRLLPVEPSTPRLGLAQRAVGLENVTITPLHAAVVAAALAHGGKAARPHLVQSVRALGAATPYRRGEAGILLEATTPSTAEVIGRAMRAVITSPEGTGRRAALPGLEFAIKTGTAGERQPGLNSIIFGYAPVEQPRVAFAFVAEHAGKAELEGARIVRDFLTTVRSEFGSR